MPRTKIIATLGPASRLPAVLRKMIIAGLDVVRLNFSHGTHAEKLGDLSLVRELNRKLRRKIGILGDLEGYRIRIGSLPAPIPLSANQLLYLSRGEKTSGNTVPFDYAGDLSAIRRGQKIFIDDGSIETVVEDAENRRLKIRVVQPGLLKEHKGVNMPGAKLEFKGLTDKDKRDLDFCIEHGIELIAQSFVRSRGDIETIRRYLGGRRDRHTLVAKIESREGIHSLSEIMRVSDGIMIARGDLGVSLPLYEVPLLQKEIIRRCRRAGKFSITATQMLESMSSSRRPTRAEVSDVSNAIIDGSDYLMLSAETAVGSFPVEAVRMMNQTIVFTEQYLKSARAIRGHR